MPRKDRKTMPKPTKRDWRKPSVGVTALVAAVESARADERRACVAYLRMLAYGLGAPGFAAAAELIAKGDHVDPTSPIVRDAAERDML